MPLRSGKVFNTVVEKEEKIQIKVEKKSSENEIRDPEVSNQPIKIEGATSADLKQEPGNETIIQVAGGSSEVKATQRFDDKNNPFWELGRNRRLFLSKYKGVEYVHIREFYTEESTG